MKNCTTISGKVLKKNIFNKSDIVLTSLQYATTAL